MKLGTWVFGVLLWAGCQPLPSKSALFDPDGDGSPWGEDCDNGNAAVYPAATDATLDGYDQNCDGVDGTDADRDGYASEATGGTDCADGDAAVYPDAGETPYDGVDNDCDSATPDDDLDADGYGAAEDCTDRDAAVHPGATEVVYDGLDNDCDPDTLDDDLDGDGYLLAEDCDDADAAVNPGVVEAPYDGVDNDCDSQTPDDDLDGDGFGVAEDCDDGSSEVGHFDEEVCVNGVVDNCFLSVGEAIRACSASVSLASATAKWVGHEGADEVGSSVTGVGDVNGDGFDDVLVGAPYWDGGYGNEGAAYLVLGGASGVVNLGEAIAMFGGVDSDESAGHSVAGPGDTDGDGCPDLLIGAPYRDQSTGVAYVVSGCLTGTVPLQEATATLFGEETFGRAGAAVSGAGDFNDDGWVDFAVGAYRKDNDAGVAYLVLGGQLDPVMSLGDSSAVFRGDAGDQAGQSLAAAGDVDGDGRDDLLIGANGVVYLMLGGATGDWSLQNADGKLSSEEGGDEAGASVAGVGDANHDGYVDLLVGAPEYNGDGNDLGAAYLILEGAREERRLGDGDLRLTGTLNLDRVGSSVSGAGDVDRDGFADFLVGASVADGVGEDSGATYLVLGADVQTGDLSEVAAAIFTGEAAGDQAGFAVSTAGDTDGDGRSDLLIGAPEQDGGGSGSGAAYLITAASLF